MDTNEGVGLVPYDPGWPREFEAERERIARVLGNIAIRIDQVGSTSVPGLSAKPVIDIQISVARLHPMDTYTPALAELGYTHVPSPGDSFAPFFHRPRERPHTHHIHVVEARGDEERRTLAFRDYLRDHEWARREYEELERQCARQFSEATAEGREAYAQAKGEFSRQIVETAVAEGYPRGM